MMDIIMKIYDELVARGLIAQTTNEEEIRKMIIQRDYNDMNREHSPLKKADDAVVLDSTSCPSTRSI